MDGVIGGELVQQHPFLLDSLTSGHEFDEHRGAPVCFRYHDGGADLARFGTACGGDGRDVQRSALGGNQGRKAKPDEEPGERCS